MEMLLAHKFAIEEAIKAKLVDKPVPVESMRLIIDAVLKFPMLVDVNAGTINEPELDKRLGEVMANALSFGLLTPKDTEPKKETLSEHERVVRHLSKELDYLRLSEGSLVDIANRIVMSGQGFDHNGELRELFCLDTVRRLQEDPKARHLFLPDEQKVENEKKVAEHETAQRHKDMFMGLSQEEFLRLDPQERLRRANAVEAQNRADNAQARCQVQSAKIVEWLNTNHPGWSEKRPEERLRLHDRAKAALSGNK